MLHLIIVLGVARLAVRLSTRLHGSVTLHVIYRDGRGVLRQLLRACDEHRWQLTGVAADPPGAARTAESLSPPAAGDVGIVLTLSGGGVGAAVNVLAATDGVRKIARLDDDVEVE